MKKVALLLISAMHIFELSGMDGEKCRYNDHEKLAKITTLITDGQAANLVIKGTPYDQNWPGDSRSIPCSIHGQTLTLTVAPKNAMRHAILALPNLHTIVSEGNEHFFFEPNIGYEKFSIIMNHGGTLTTICPSGDDQCFVNALDIVMYGQACYKGFSFRGAQVRASLYGSGYAEVKFRDALQVINGGFGNLYYKHVPIRGDNDLCPVTTFGNGNGKVIDATSLFCPLYRICDIQ